MARFPTPRSPRRSFLFTPADDRHKIDKAAGLNADVIILDLEDAVAPNRKDAARTMALAALATIDFGRPECLVRVNAPGTPFFAEDLAALATSDLAGIVLPQG